MPQSIRHRGQIAHTVIGILRHAAVRRCLFHNPVQGVIGVHGCAAQRICDGLQISIGIIGVRCLCTHGIGHRKYLSQQIIGDLRHTAHGIDLTDRTVHGIVFRGYDGTVGQRAGQKIACPVVRHGLRKSIGIGNTQRQSHCIIGVGCFSAERIDFLCQQSCRVILAQCSAAHRVGHTDEMAVPVISISRAAAQSVRFCFELPVFGVSPCLYRFVRQDGLRQLSQAVILIFCCTAPGIGYRCGMAQRVISVRNGCPVRKGQLQQIALRIMLIKCNFSQCIGLCRQMSVRVVDIDRDMAHRVGDLRQKPIDVFVPGCVSQRVCCTGLSALFIICIDCHAAVRVCFRQQIAMCIIGILCFVPVLVLPAEQVMVFIPCKRDSHAAGIDFPDLIAAGVVLIGRDMPRRVGFADNLPLRAIGEPGLAAQSIHNARGALPFIKIIENSISFRICGYGMVRIIGKPVPSSVGIRLGDDTVLPVIGVLYLSGSSAVPPGCHTALLIILILRDCAVRVYDCHKVLSLVHITNFRAARQRQLRDMSCPVHFHGQLFLRGGDDLRDQSVFIPHDLCDMLSTVFLHAGKQAAGLEDIHGSIGQGNTVFCVCVVIGKLFIFGCIGGKAAIRLTIEDDFAAVCAAEGG